MPWRSNSTCLAASSATAPRRTWASADRLARAGCRPAFCSPRQPGRPCGPGQTSLRTSCTSGAGDLEELDALILPLPPNHAERPGIVVGLQIWALKQLASDDEIHAACLRLGLRQRSRVDQIPHEDDLLPSVADLPGHSAFAMDARAKRRHRTGRRLVVVAPALYGVDEVEVTGQATCVRSCVTDLPGHDHFIADRATHRSDGLE